MTNTTEQPQSIMSLFEFQTELLRLLREFSEYSISVHDSNVLHALLDMAVERHNFVKRLSHERQTEEDLIGKGLLYSESAVQGEINRLLKLTEE